MPKQSITTLKNWFKRGLKPLENQFADWMDSFWHQDQTIPIDKVTDLQNTLNALVSTAALTATIDGIKGGVPAGGDTLNKLYDLIVGMGNFAGDHDASGNLLPTVGTGANNAIDKGDYWRVSVGGNIPALGDVKPGDTIFSRVNNADVAADFFVVENNQDLATPTVMGLVKLVQEIGVGAADAVLSTANLKTLLDAKKNLTANVASDLTGNIAGGVLTIAADGMEETEVFLKTEADLNISWTGLNDGGIIYLRIERTATNPISLNFNGAANLDCFMDGSTQQLGAASPLSIAGHNGASGINRIHHRISIEAVKDITANKLIYLIRESNTGSISV